VNKACSTILDTYYSTVANNTTGSRIQYKIDIFSDMDDVKKETEDMKGIS
jgi:hypothetical protein